MWLEEEGEKMGQMYLALSVKNLEELGQELVAGGKICSFSDRIDTV